MTANVLALVCTLIVTFIGAVGFIYTIRDRRKAAETADEAARTKVEDDLKKAYADGFNAGDKSRNDEISMWRLRAEDLQRTNERLADRNERLEDRVLEVGRIEIPHRQPRPSSRPGDQP